MAPWGRPACSLPLAVAAIVVGLLAIVIEAAPSATAPAVPTATTPPCPFITASSPQTLSTNPPPGILCPGVLVGTYFGGTASDWAFDVALDTDGNAFVVGFTNSSDFPTTPDAHDPSPNGDYDAFLAKFARSGAPLYSTLFGGSSSDVLEALALDASGNAYVVGSTNSSDFPTTPGALDTTYNGGGDAVLAKFDSSGALTYATLLGGTGADAARALMVDPFGNAYVLGATWSADFPVTPGAYHAGHIVSKDSSKDFFITKVDPTGSALVYSAVIGGMRWDEPFDLAIDGAGAAYVVGYTESSDFPITADAFDDTLSDLGDPFALKLAPDGRSLGYSTFLGGSGGWCEDADAIVLDSTGTAYITGSACSFDFPTTPGARGYSGGYDDAYFMVLAPSGAVQYSTLFGGSGMDEGYATFLDETGHVYLTGYTESPDFPTSEGSFDPTYNGHRDAFVAKFDLVEKAFNYSTYLGGGDDLLLGETTWVYNIPCDATCGDLGFSIAVDVNGNATVVGSTSSLDFPTTEGAYSTRYRGETDAFVTRMDFLPEPNRAPFAYFGVTAPPDDGGRAYVDATQSADAEDVPDLLEVRWDWEDDGVWDAGWSTVKTASHDYAAAGTYTIRLEVRDTDGLTGDTARQVVVTGPVTPGIIWVRQFGGSGHEAAEGVAVDSSGVYVASGTGLQKYDADGNLVWTRNGGADVAVGLSGVYAIGGWYLYKYDADGNVLWTRTPGWGAGGYIRHYAVAIGGSDVYVLGCAATCPEDTAVFSPEFSVWKYDSQGNLLWNRTYGFYIAAGLAVDLSGVYVGGLPGILVKYDPEGNLLWTRYPVSGLWGVAVDATGVFVAGHTGDAVPGQVSAGGLDAVLLKYDSEGNLLWTRQFGTAGHDRAFGVTVGPSGVYIAGSTDGALPGETSAGNADAFLGRYDGAGNLLWTHQFGTPAADEALAVAADAFEVYAAGDTYGTFLGEANAGEMDAFLARLRVLPERVPGAPVNLQATAGDGRISLYWQAPVSDSGSAVTNYRIYRGTVSGSLAFVIEVGDLLTYTDANVMNGVTYYYQVSGVNALGEGPKANEVSATPEADAVPPTVAISSPQADAILHAATVTVTGTASDDVAVEKIEASSDGATWILASGTSSWSVTLTLREGSNTIRVRATDTSGKTGSASVRVMIDSAPPTLSIQTPSQDAILASSSVELTWTADDATSGLDHFELRLEGRPAISLSAEARRYLLVGLEDGTHTATVVAFDRAGHSSDASVRFYVEAGPIGGLGPQALDFVTAGLAAAVVIGIAASGAFLVLRHLARRKRHRPS